MEQTEYNKAKVRMIISLVFLACGVIYILSPIDFIPDLLGPVGWVDDLGVLLFTAITATVSFFKLNRAEKKLKQSDNSIER